MGATNKGAPRSGRALLVPAMVAVAGHYRDIGRSHQPCTVRGTPTKQVLAKRSPLLPRDGTYRNSAPPGSCSLCRFLRTRPTDFELMRTRPCSTKGLRPRPWHDSCTLVGHDSIRRRDELLLCTHSTHPNSSASKSSQIFIGSKHSS